MSRIDSGGGGGGGGGIATDLSKLPRGVGSVDTGVGPVGPVGPCVVGWAGGDGGVAASGVGNAAAGLGAT